jgi:hypothetical protein
MGRYCPERLKNAPAYANSLSWMKRGTSNVMGAR